MVANGEGRLFHRRIPGHRYIIGADPATGRQITAKDVDRSAAVVLDLETGEEMAAYRSIVRPEEFAFDLADLGSYYNNAVIAVERTGDGGSVILTLVNDAKYMGIFKYKEWHRRERKVVEYEGFPTTKKTRPIALNFLNAFVCDHPEFIWDDQFLNEALVFVRDIDTGIPAAARVIKSFGDAVEERSAGLPYLLAPLLRGARAPGAMAVADSSLSGCQIGGWMDQTQIRDSAEFRQDETYRCSAERRYPNLYSVSGPFQIAEKGRRS
jgi:hypothetical protein